MKLMTKEIEKELRKNPIGSKDGQMYDAEVIVKYFTPWGGATWLITEGEKLENGDWLLFGFCNLGDIDMAEFGEVLLSSLESIRGPWGLTIERDLYFNKQTIKEAYAQMGIEL